MSSARVVVNLPNKPSYDVRIAPGQYADLADRVRELLPKASRAAIITDSNVNPLYGDAVRE